MSKPGWRQWLTENYPASVYLIVNVLAKPDPVVLLYACDCIGQAARIYDGTPLAHIPEQSPWLIQVKPRAYLLLGRLMDERAFSDPSWGWAYRSRRSFQENIDHWRCRQLVKLKEDTVILRLADSRVASVLLPAMHKSDWRLLLLTPAEQVCIDTPGLTTFRSPVPADELPGREMNDLPFELPPHLVSAWQDSPNALHFYADNFACELWEHKPESALVLDTPAGRLMPHLTAWLKEQSALLTDLNSLTYEDFIRHTESGARISESDGDTA